MRNVPADDPNDPIDVTYGVTDYGATCYTDIGPRTGGLGSNIIVPNRDKSLRMDGFLKRGMTTYRESYYDGTGNTRPTRGRGYGNDTFRRYWRWAEPDSAFGVSGQPNNKARPMSESIPYPAFGATAGNNAGANDELFSFHSGGVNCLFGDGGVRFIKDEINLMVLRASITAKGHEAISNDQY